ncbi:MAG TPA: phospholipase D-like domain-containing protein [Bacteroidales bacterium]|nr:phospholipase D-like domain-containing protein [Bacteroidales bacterium]
MSRRSQGIAYKSGHQVTLLRSGEEFFAAVESIIDGAKNYIHFQSYILDEDETGNRMINALVRAAGRGVRTYILLDAYGTRYLSDELVKKIEDSGILFRFFSPTFITKGYQLSLRLHSKVVLADGDVAIIGGMNFANRYHGYGKKKEWLDFAVKIRGPECAQLLDITRKLWNKKFISKEERSNEYIHDPQSYPDNISVKILQNNWYRNKIEILQGYRTIFRKSQKSMILFSGYFLPGRNERRLLRLASMRGVDIKIVLAAESDAPVFDRATQFLYDFILRNNIKIYEYLPSNLHAKVATVDGVWCTVGSYNLNHLSDYGSIEINASIFDEGFTQDFEEKLLEIIKNDCREITPEIFKKRRTWFYRVSGWFSYQMIRIMMRIMFRLTTKKKKP